MDASTIAFHRIIVRALRGILVAWDRWLTTQDTARSRAD